MFGVRILVVATAYSVVLLEIYSGAIAGPVWWVYPGALVIALLLSISLFGVGADRSGSVQGGFLAGAVQWLLLLAMSFAMSYFANYFGREILPGIIAS